MSQLQVITTISNPARYESRYRLYRDFCARMKSCGASLYTIELAADDQDFSVTESTNPFHFQLRSSHELWYKENLVNIAIGRLPSDWQYVAWVDADVSFARPDWGDETIRIEPGVRRHRGAGHAERIGSSEVGAGHCDAGLQPGQDA